MAAVASAGCIAAPAAAAAVARQVATSAPSSVESAALSSGFSPASSLRSRTPSLPVLPRRRLPGCVAAISVDKPDGAGVVLVDHYKRLGVSPDATNAEIVKAFEARCRELTEDGAKGAVDEEDARQRLQDLETSFDVLTSEEARRLYDWGIKRAQRGDADDYVWPFETDVTQKAFTPGGSRPMAPVDEEGVAITGYIFVAWLILSAVLSVTLV